MNINTLYILIRPFKCQGLNFDSLRASDFLGTALASAVGTHLGYLMEFMVELQRMNEPRLLRADLICSSSMETGSRLQVSHFSSPPPAASTRSFAPPAPIHLPLGLHAVHVQGKAHWEWPSRWSMSCIATDYRSTAASRVQGRARHVTAEIREKGYQRFGVPMRRHTLAIAITIERSGPAGGGKEPMCRLHEKVQRLCRCSRSTTAWSWE